MKNQTPLGQQVTYPQDYSPELLCSIPREQGRLENSLEQPIFFGADYWTAYEISWLDNAGKPQVRIGEIVIPCDSENLVESKSLKLYLNSFNNSRFASENEVLVRIKEDLADCVKAEVGIQLKSLDANSGTFQSLLGTCLDSLDITVEGYSPESAYLKNAAGEKITESVYSHLLKTNCPVTNQPDWATVWISYSGKPIDHKALLKYLISFRNHQDFHEQCIEKIYADIMQRCMPEELQVYGRYTRRGGLDINPYRCSEEGMLPPQVRIERQ